MCVRVSVCECVQLCESQCECEAVSEPCGVPLSAGPAADTRRPVQTAAHRVRPAFRLVCPHQEHIVILMGYDIVVIIGSDDIFFRIYPHPGGIVGHPHPPERSLSPF